ncbi:hypothetical protein AC1031_015049 [Aphanomyces cochlioides]|nr:hypothetical protein AC1031_015049 [Aphanomyces cochlioides]
MRNRQEARSSGRWRATRIRYSSSVAKPPVRRPFAPVSRMFEHNGQRGYACLLESVDIPECPSFEHSHGLVRATVRHTGFIFTELQVGVLHVMQCMHLDWSGTAPAWVAKSFCKRRITALPTVLDRFFTRRRSSFDQTQMMASTSKKHCG